MWQYLSRPTKIHHLLNLNCQSNPTRAQPIPKGATVKAALQNPLSNPPGILRLEFHTKFALRQVLVLNGIDTTQQGPDASGGGFGG